MSKPKHVLVPLLLGVSVAAGMIIGSYLNPNGGSSTAAEREFSEKFQQVLGFINKAYVDSTDSEELVDKAIGHVLEELDPYSTYIPAAQLQHANEQLEGNFEGIGVEFNIIDDTVTVIHPIPGGPSEKLGILPGDKIVKVEGESIAGIGIENAEVIKRLKGEKGTRVNVSILRRTEPELLDFTILRDEIKIQSVVASHMIGEETAFIKVVRFAANTKNDIRLRLQELKDRGANKLILDLRGNPGGYLNTATAMADLFLSKNDLIVYTQGRSRERKEYTATGDGIFQEGRLAVLLDEGSASASEIVAGAIQDLDRGLIVGRPSHGKGLVQEPISLKDGSQIRLTVARYYTPSGRCIQRPYQDALDGKTSVWKQRSDTTGAFQTRAGRKVQEGGGILPDVYVARDSAFSDPFVRAFIGRGLLWELGSSFTDENRKELTERYSDATQFAEAFIIPATLENRIFQMAKEAGIKENLRPGSPAYSYLDNQLKALIARNLWDDNAFYQIVNREDPVIRKTLKLFQSDRFADFGVNPI